MRDDSADIAERLRLAREQAGLSQAQVAKALDMHRPTISEIEAGRRRVQAEELRRFAELFDVSIAWLAGDTATGQSAKVELAARELSKLKAEDLDRVLNLLGSLRQTPAKKGPRR